VRRTYENLTYRQKEFYRDVIELDGKTLVDSVEEAVKSNFIRLFNMNVKEDFEYKDKGVKADSSNLKHFVNNEANRADTKGCQDYRDHGK
jgi:hypothetical protein